MMKPWIKPELIVLVRNTLDENILAKKPACKMSGSVQALGSNGGHFNSACLMKSKKCKRCKQESS